MIGLHSRRARGARRGGSALALLTAILRFPVPACSEKIHVTADFENVAGVYEGNEVSVLGIPIGTVDKITPRGTYVEVAMTLDADTKVPADAIAAGVSPSIVTDRHVELTPVYTDGPTLADGDHIPLGRTRTPVELDTMIATIDEFAAALSPDPASGEPRSAVG